MDVATTAIPVNPNIPAMIARIKNIKAAYNMIRPPLIYLRPIIRPTSENKLDNSVNS